MPKLPAFCMGIVLLGAAAVAVADESVDLFAAGDLSGWVVEGAATRDSDRGPQPVWTLHDGLLHCAGAGFGFLRYDRPLTDFTLRLEYRTTPGCNSGVGIRGVKFSGRARTRPSFAGYELQILDDAGSPPSRHGSMSLYRYAAPLANAARPAGEWNQCEITCQGPRIRIVLNGQVVHDLDQTAVEGIQDKPLEGYISLQNHGREIDFRHVRLEEPHASP